MCTLHHLYVALPLPIVNCFQVDAGSATKKMKTEIPSAKKTSNLVAQAFGSDVCSLCFIMQQCFTCLEMSYIINTLIKIILILAKISFHGLFSPSGVLCYRNYKINFTWPILLRPTSDMPRCAPLKQPDRSFHGHL